MPKENQEQKKIVGRVMHEFKHGELGSSQGGKVRSRRQAVAIALSEAGASNEQSPRQNRRQLSHTRSKERHGDTAQQRKEGPHATDRKPASDSGTRADLYQEAARRGIAGRSRMNKQQLQNALAH